MRSTMALVVVAGMAAPVMAQFRPIEAVIATDAHVTGTAFSNKADVPGLTGARVTNVGGVTRTADGSRWSAVLTFVGANPNQGFVISDAGGGLGFSVAASEANTTYGQIAGTARNVNFDTLGTRPIKILNDGSWATSFPITGSSGERVAVRFDAAAPAGSQFTLFQLSGQATTAPALSGFTYGQNTHSADIFADKSIGFANGDLFNLNTAALIREGVFRASGAENVLLGDSESALASVLAPQLNDPGVPLFDVDDEDLFWANNGSYLFIGDLRTTGAEPRTTTASDKVVVVNGSIVVQEGVALAGFTSPVSTILSQAFMEADGSWVVLGRNADNIDWVLRNGTLIAVEGQAIVPGASETWTSFTDARSNGFGDYVVVGNTSNADSNLNSVAVLNGSRVLVRENDLVDMDNDGAADDDRRVSQFNDERNTVTQNRYFFSARLRNGTTLTAIGTSSSLLSVGLVSADANSDGLVNSLDIAAYIGGWQSSRVNGNLRFDFNLDGVVNSLDIAAFISAWQAARAG